MFRLKLTETSGSPSSCTSDDAGVRLETSAYRYRLDPYYCKVFAYLTQKRDQFFCKLSLVLTIYLAVETICPRWWLRFKLITVIFDKDLSDECVYVNDIIYCEISIYKLLLWFVFIMLVTQWIIRERQLGQSRILLCYHYNLSRLLEINLFWGWPADHPTEHAWYMTMREAC